MDVHRFDDLVKRLACTPRRQALGSLVGGLIATIGIDDTDAATAGHSKKRIAKQDTKRNSGDAASE
jgi:hypothetical protein